MDAQPKSVFERVEKKYIVTEEILGQLLKRFDPYLVQDRYGLYTICNIYYDTDSRELIRNSIEKPDYKEKLRLRSYGVPNNEDTVFLEIKKKCGGTVFKRRISLSLEEAESYLENGKKPDCKQQILSEIDYFIRFYQPKPQLFLAYDRLAFTGRDDGTVRITLDHNIRSRDTALDMKKGDYGRPLLDPSCYVMEIKVSSAIPLWLAQLLSEYRIYPVSFSKYGNIYKRELTENAGAAYHACAGYQYTHTRRLNEKERKESCLQVY